MSFYASTGQPQDPAGQQPHPGRQSRPSQLPPPAIPRSSASPVGRGSSSSTTTGANSQQQQTPATFKGLHQLTGAPTPPVPLSTVTAFGSGGLSGTGGRVEGGGLADGVSAVGGGGGERGGGMAGGTAPGSSALGAGGEGGQLQQQQVGGSAAGWGKNGSYGSSSVPEGVFEFTKRKKWANLLVNELSDTVVFVLVPTPQGGARIVYTSPGIRDLLGYSVKDVENRAIADLVYEPDLPPLLNYLQQSISNRTDLSSYHRFLPKRTPSAFLLSSPNTNAEGTSDSPTFLASTPNNDDDGQGGVGTGMTTPSDDSDANQEAGRRGSVESGYGGIGINQSDRKADAAERPVLLELRGHGYWGEEADRAPIPLSLTTGSTAIPSGLPGGNTPSLSSGSASSSSASVSPSVHLGSNVNGNGSSSGGDGQRCKCFFLMARRWPSRTGEMLDAFLEEKMENERLRAELMELMGPNGMAEEVYEGINDKTDADYYLRQSTIPGLPSAFFSPTTSLLPPTFHTSGSQPPPLHHHGSSSSSSGAGGYVSQAGGSSFEYDGIHVGAEPSGGAYEDDNSASASASASDDDDGDGAGYRPPALAQPVPATIATGWLRNKKAAAATDVAPGAGPSAGGAASGSTTSKPAKKAKKSGTKDEGHVCTVCGRTDSPEWRKGPMGPKTLCNACGLRYAKKNAAAGNALVKKKGASVVGTPAPGVGGGDK